MNRLVLLVLAIVFGLRPSFAQIPHTLSYQGILADTAGTPKPDGNYSFTFRLYTVSSAGVQSGARRSLHK